VIGEFGAAVGLSAFGLAFGPAFLRKYVRQIVGPTENCVFDRAPARLRNGGPGKTIRPGAASEASKNKVASSKSQSNVPPRNRRGAPTCAAHR
jgi:hypothetical protein